MNWQLEIAFHWPHNRFALGWDYLAPSDEEPFHTYRLYLFVVTLTLDIE